MTSLPPDKIILAAARTSSQHAVDGFLRPLCLDYYEESKTDKALIKVRPDKTKYLFKSDEEWTSDIEKTYKVNDDSGLGHYIIVTENSIYVTVATIKAVKETTPPPDKDTA